MISVLAGRGLHLDHIATFIKSSPVPPVPGLLALLCCEPTNCHFFVLHFFPWLELLIFFTNLSCTPSIILVTTAAVASSLTVLAPLVPQPPIRLLTLCPTLYAAAWLLALLRPVTSVFVYSFLLPSLRTDPRSTILRPKSSEPYHYAGVDCYIIAQGSPDRDDARMDTEGITKAPKDKNCPYCGQAFTSSSLGRHLDLYIKSKNPKAPDGIHNVDEIRRIRGSITRRQPRGSARRDASAVGGSQSGSKRSPAASDTDSVSAQSPGTPTEASFAGGLHRGLLITMSILQETAMRVQRRHQD